MTLVIILIIAVMVLISCIVTLLNKKYGWDNIFHGMNRIWQHRNNLLPKYITKIGENGAVDKELLSDIQQLNQQMIHNNLPPEEKLDIDNKIMHAFNKVNLAFESLPASEQDITIIKLRSDIQATNNKLLSERATLNKAGSEFNNMLSIFPASTVGKLMKLVPKKIVEVQPEHS